MRTVSLGALLALTLGSAAAAQALLIVPVPTHPYRGYETIHLSRAAMAGQETRVWWAQMIEPDCTPHGSMTTAVVDQPQHGAVRLSDDAFFPNFAAPNPRAVCDTMKVAGKQAFYTAEAGYKGRDKLVLQNSTTEGRIRKIVVDLDVG